METFNALVRKISGFLMPLWTLITIVGGIVCCTYWVSCWGIERQDVEKQQQYMIQGMETRITTLESHFVAISEKQDKILYILNQKFKSHENIT